MRTTFAIAYKDLLQQLHSPSTLVLVLVTPLAITALFGFAFGGFGGGEQSIAAIPVQVVNLDQGAALVPGVPLPGSPGKIALGRIVVESLQSPEVADVVEAILVDDEAAARAAVESGKAAAAVIIPADFTASVVAATGRKQAEVEIYSDPARQVGPGVVRSIVERVVDSISGASIATSIAASELEARGARLGLAELVPTMSRVAQRYAAAATQEPAIALDRREFRPGGEQNRDPRGAANLLATICVGMMIYFIFFNGANMARTILEEDQNGTLARLFTTPTPRRIIFAGKFLGVFLSLAAQCVIFLVSGRLLFGIVWGDYTAVAVVTAATIVAAAGLGILIVSFVRTPQQAGPIIGGGLAVLAMAGGNFTAAIEMPPGFDLITRFTPNGWALAGWSAVLRGADATAVLAPVLVLCALGAVFLAAGTLMFRRRFA